MGSDWQDTTLGGILELQRGFDLPVDARRDGAVPVIASTGVVGTHDQAMVKAPGVVIGRSGSIGGGQYLTTDFWPLNTTLWVKDFKGNDPRFCYYLLRSMDFSGFNAGSGVPTLNRNHIHPLPARRPPLPEQRAIAHILGTLDDKIELNRRINETLEAIARAVFKSWFVDFDPVRAKAEGRDPLGMDAETAALFPSNFQRSSLGSIPEGWQVAELRTIAEVIDCLHSKKPARQATGRPLLQLWNIRDDGLIDMTDTYWITEEDYRLWISRIEARAGDCVITNVGRVGAVAQLPEGLKAALGRNMTAVRSKPSYPFPTFLVECLLSEAMRREIDLKVDSGTILDSLNVKNIPRLRLILPLARIMERFERLCRPVRAKMEQGLTESQVLIGIRDALLPKLVSGQLKVRDAENFLEAAV